MDATKKNNLQRIIQSKLTDYGIKTEIFPDNDHADLIGYDANGKYFAIKFNDERNVYFEGKTGIRKILCTSYDEFISLFLNKKPLTKTENPKLWQE